jgi:hypothetical protein
MTKSLTLDAKQQEKIGEVLGRCFSKRKAKSGDEAKKEQSKKKMTAKIKAF